MAVGLFLFLRKRKKETSAETKYASVAHAEQSAAAVGMKQMGEISEHAVPGSRTRYSELPAVSMHRYSGHAMPEYFGETISPGRYEDGRDLAHEVDAGHVRRPSELQS